MYVDAGATGNNDGSSWANAYNHLQDALADPNAQAILVADGTYYPDTNSANPSGSGDRTASFVLKNNVRIYGGYAGFGAPDPNARDINAYETILSGDIGTPGNDSDNSYHVVTGSGVNSTAFLDGFTITAGNADGTFPDSAGGGIFCWSSGSPTITHCNITGNFALLGGGICCNDSSNAGISYCTISGNTGAAWGGGIVFANGTPSISHSTITGNWANRGGGIYCMDDGPKITHCTITRCTISGNRAVIISDIGGIGGGISCDGWSDTTISNCIFWSNSAPTGPEIALEFDCNLTVSYTKVQGEQADAYVEGGCTLNWGIGNTNADPCFADPGYWDPNGTPADANDDFWVNGDYHLKSQAGRWDPNSKSWVNDPVTSPCIDLGNPGCPLRDEPNDANNVRINMGAYGGTTEASKTPAGWSLLADLTNDGTVDFKDFAWQAKDWLHSESEQQGDLNRDGTVDVRDLALFVEHWLEQTIWHEL